MNTVDTSSAPSAQYKSGLYQAIFDAGEDSIAVYEFDTGRLLDINPKACESSGFSREELLSSGTRSLGSGIPPSTDAALREYMALARQDRCPPFEWQRRNKDGSLHWGEIRLKPVELGDTRYILAFRHDITDQKAMLEALKLREEQYRVIFEASSNGFVLRDSQLRTVDANPAFYRMYGFERAHIMAGGGYPAAFPREYVEERDAQIRRALAGEATHIESIAYRADGTSFWIDLRVIPVQYRGEPHVLQVVRDITARREAEARREQLEGQLRQSQKMEAIGQLTGGIAHDFNNILTSVIGYIILATERAEPIGDAKLTRQLGQAHLAAQRARDLIAQMLTFARRGSAGRKPIALPALVEQSLSLLRSTLPSTILVDLDVAPSLSAIAADEVQIEQILFNLCINARDAMQGSGRLRVVLREHAVTGECASCRSPVSGRWVELAVTDDGSGIAPDVMQRMFDPFYTTKAVGRGSGMGLAMAHGIVHDHGGHILVESVMGTQAGHGSTLRILLPPAEGRAAPDPALPPQRNARQPQLHGRLLLVEDEPSVGEYMQELLEGWGMEVEVCRDPIDALKRFSTDAATYDLVLTDQTMPTMSGAELVRQLLELRPGLPAILYTGNRQGLDDVALARSGVQAVLHKPVDRDVLASTLRRLLPIQPAA